MAQILRRRITAPIKARLATQAGVPALAWAGWFDRIGREMDKRSIIVETGVDPASIPAGAVLRVQLTVTGAGVQRRDFVVPSFDQLAEDVMMTAAVTDTDEITVSFLNTSASPVDMTTGTLRVLVEAS